MIIDHKEIDREYDQTRLENERLCSNRLLEVSQKVPGYKELSDEAINLSAERVRLMLAKAECESKEEYHKKLEKIRKKKFQLMLKAGYPEDYLEPIYKCTNCKDTGYEGKPGFTQKCNCRRKKESEYLYSFSGLKELLEDNNFDRFTDKFYKSEDDVREYNKIYELCKKYVLHFSDEDFCEDLLFLGSVGTGKTFFSCCIAKELMDQGKIVLFFSTQRLKEEIMSTFGKTDNTASLKEFLRWFFEADLLILDDLGAESVSRFYKDVLKEIIEERTNHKLPIIYTTNLSFSEISECYGDRIFSRITARMNYCEFPQGNDLRLLKMLDHQDDNKMK